MSTTREWDDWRWQLERARHGAEIVGLDGSAAPVDFPVAVTPYYWSLADPSDPHDPICRMVLPIGDERPPGRAVREDPIEEERHAVMPGLIRRYPDRALLLVHGECPVHCRHCTRRALGRGKVVPIRGADLDRALAYVAAHPEIRDVILSGGDPLLLEDEVIAGIVARVRAIPSVDIVRIGTKVPAALPVRVTEALARALAARGPLYINTQFNHPRELTEDAAGAVARFVDAGIPVANQSVLLAGVNDDPDVMEALCRRLLVARVRPYYLFACDLVAGAERFRVPLARAIAIMAHLRGRIGGLGIPTLVVDLPGGLGKVPIGPSYVAEIRGGTYVLRAPNGALVEYPDAEE
jgi:lysine 2,3-aminomutase